MGFWTDDSEWRRFPLGVIESDEVSDWDCFLCHEHVEPEDLPTPVIFTWRGMVKIPHALCGGCYRERIRDDEYKKFVNASINLTLAEEQIGNMRLWLLIHKVEGKTPHKKAKQWASRLSASLKNAQREAKVHESSRFHCYLFMPKY